MDNASHLSHPQQLAHSPIHQCSCWSWVIRKQEAILESLRCYASPISSKSITDPATISTVLSSQMAKSLTTKAPRSHHDDQRLTSSPRGHSRQKSAINVRVTQTPPPSFVQRVRAAEVNGKYLVAPMIHRTRKNITEAVSYPIYTSPSRDKDESESGNAHDPTNNQSRLPMGIPMVAIQRERWGNGTANTEHLGSSNTVAMRKSPWMSLSKVGFVIPSRLGLCTWMPHATTSVTRRRIFMISITGVPLTIVFLVITPNELPGTRSARVPW